MVQIPVTEIQGFFFLILKYFPGCCKFLIKLQDVTKKLMGNL